MSESGEHEADLLRRHKTLVVVGLSSDPSRASYRVSAYMQQHGYHIIPVNPSETEVLGERCYPLLAEVPGPVEFVDVFRRSEACPELAREAAAKGAKVLWLQLGIVSPEARQIAATAGIDYVEDRCVMVVHRQSIGG
jgi:predicted CoA-binding protein